jgi:hypothetical protein
MSTVNLEAYIKYTTQEGENEYKRIHSEKVSLDSIEHVAVGLCSEHGFDDSFVKEESDSSGQLSFLARDTKKKRELQLVLKGKKQVLEEIEDTGILES